MNKHVQALGRAAIAEALASALKAELARVRSGLADAVFLNSEKQTAGSNKTNGREKNNDR